MNAIRNIALAAAALAVLALSAVAGERLCTGGGDSFVLRNGDVTLMTGEGMSAPSLRALKQKYGAKFFWVRRAGRSYVVRDQATLDRAWAATQPQTELGAQQAAIGSEQAAIGMSQASMAFSGDSETQKSLAKSQQRLARRQQQLAKAQKRHATECDRQLCALADEAIKNGKATPVN